MWRVTTLLILTAAACGTAPAEAAHVDPVGRQRAEKPPAPVELSSVSSRVDGAHVGDVAGALRKLLPDALSDADWHGISRDQHLKVTAAVVGLSSRGDGGGLVTECVVEIALVDASGGLLGAVRGHARVEGGPLADAERDALDTAARQAAKSVANAARAATHK